MQPQRKAIFTYTAQLSMSQHSIACASGWLPSPPFSSMPASPSPFQSCTWNLPLPYRCTTSLPNRTHESVTPRLPTQLASFHCTARGDAQSNRTELCTERPRALQERLGEKSSEQQQGTNLPQQQQEQQALAKTITNSSKSDSGSNE